VAFVAGLAVVLAEGGSDVRCWTDEWPVGDAVPPFAGGRALAMTLGMSATPLGIGVDASATKAALTSTFGDGVDAGAIVEGVAAGTDVGTSTVPA
jgi:hypothetical protein